MAIGSSSSGGVHREDATEDGSSDGIADFPRIVAQQCAEESAHRQAQAAVLEAGLNRFLQHATFRTYEERRTAVAWISANLDYLGLAVVCPKTGWAAHLACAKGGSSTGRFQLHALGGDGKLHRTVSTTCLPDLGLCAMKFDDAAQRTWQNRAIRTREEGPTRNG